jgi:inosine-uridine nucleoside N-ribohydrolase
MFSPAHYEYSNKIPVWLDCDPGQDDMMAIILAAYNDRIHLLGISTVAGNHTVDNVTQNTLNILELTDLNYIDVVKGVSSALTKTTFTVTQQVHGKTGMDGAKLPFSGKSPLPKNAIVHLYETILSHPKPVTIVATGALTNIALLLKIFPEVVTKIEEIVIMGGAIAECNVDSGIEFNIANDPEAAHLVFHSDLKVTMVPLDVTHTVLCTKEIINKFVEMDTEFSKIITDCLMFYADEYFKQYKMIGAPLHDPCAVAFVINRELFEYSLMNVEVETQSSLSRGRTVCDLYGSSDRPKNVQVCTKIDVDRFWNLMFDAVERANSQSKYGIPTKGITAPVKQEMETEVENLPTIPHERSINEYNQNVN